jgi:hypothetical protein
MATGQGGAGDLLPHGEALQRALRWLEDRTQDDPRVDRLKAVEEAGIRFDLTPFEEEFLLRNWAVGKR